jgi:hypothetical protein
MFAVGEDRHVYFAEAGAPISDELCAAGHARVDSSL